MTVRNARRLAVCLTLVLAMTSGASRARSLQVPPSPNEMAGRPIVYAAVVDGIIHPVSAEYMIGTLQQANLAGAALVVFTLRTPGGLLDSTRAIVSSMIASRAPVAVFVSPSGARAASAGFILTIAADIAAMSPGTHIGAAHPVEGGGAKMDEIMSKKATEDSAAYARTLATRRHRNVDLAAAAVTESRAFTDGEATAAVPPLIDAVARDIPDLLRQLDGRTVTRFDGTTVVLKTRDAQILPIEMSLRQRILSAVAHPNIAYLLLSLGTLAVTIELWSPGAIVPGVVGGVSLLLAFFALSVLPVNYAGLLLVLFGLLLLVLEIKVTSFGLLTTGGVISLIFGSMILMDSPLPELQLSLTVVVPIVLGFAAVAVLLARLAIAAQRQPPIMGQAAMIGQTGEALTAIAPERAGQVATRGEIWNATSAEPISSGARVRVTAVDRLTLVVRKD